MVLTFKRMALLAGRPARAYAKIAELTPARADLMLALLFRSRHQNALSLELGVTHPVVSRMVTSLAKLGLVIRTKGEPDRRKRMVSLTEDGRKALERLFEGFLSDQGDHTVQGFGEDTILVDFEQELESAGIRCEGFVDEQQAFLTRVQPVVWQHDYLDEWFGFGPTLNQRMQRSRAAPPAAHRSSGALVSVESAFS